MNIHEHQAILKEFTPVSNGVVVYPDEVSKKISELKEEFVLKLKP